MNKSSKLARLLSVAITVVMLLGVISVGMVANATHYDTHVPGQIYLQGDTVLYNGGVYKAKYWTQSTPGGADWEFVEIDSANLVPTDAMKNPNEKMDDYRVIYYVTQWNWPGSYDPVTQSAKANIDVSKITHINYAFGHVATMDAQGNAFPGYVDVPDPAKLHALVALKELNPNLKVLLSIGGWGADGFCPIAADANKTKVFANSCKQIMEEFGIDGIDIDWEYPGTIGDHLDVLTCSHLKLPVWEEASKKANEVSVFIDGMNYIKLLRTVRETIGWDYLLTIASGVGYDWMCSSSIGELPDYLDFINIMCYDLYGNWIDHSEYNANLMPKPGFCDDTQPSTGNPLSYDVVCDRLAYRGYPRDIMNIGIPFYGRDKVLGQGDDSWLTYRQVQELKAKGGKVNWDDVTHASYLTGTIDGRTYDVTYDDLKDVQEKMAWIQEKGYGGAMVWEYSQDDDNRTLSNAIWEGLNGSGRKQAPPTPSYRFDGTKAGFTTGQDEPKQSAEATVNGVNTIWQSWRCLIGNHPDVVYYGGYSWTRIDHDEVYNNGYTWMANRHQGTFGWAPAYAPIFAQQSYKTPDCITGGNFDVKYPEEWMKAAEHPETRFARNEAGKKKGAVKDGVLKIETIQPDKFTAPVGSTINWNVVVDGGSGNYTITNEIWFNGLKYDEDGSVKYEKRRTGGPYPNPTAAARVDATNTVVQKEVQEGDKMDTITPTITGSGAQRTVSAKFDQEGLYYCYTVVKDSSGTIASVYSQGVQIGEGLIVTPNPVQLNVGDTQQMSASMDVTEWDTTDHSVATIDSKTGLLTAVSEGKCQVVALSGDAAFGKRGYADVTVGNGGSTGGDNKIDGDFLLMKRDVNKGYLNGELVNAVNYGGGVYATPLSVNGTYALPLRSIGEAFGMKVDYLGSGVTKITNAKGEYVVVTRDSTLIEKFAANGNRIASFTADFATYSVQAGTSSITYVPMRAVSEALGLGVRYVSGTESGVGTSYVAVSTDMFIELKMDAVKAEIAKAYAMGLK